MTVRPDLRAPILTGAATLSCAAGVLAGPAALAVPAGLLLAFVLPGLALIALIFRYRVLSAVERTVLAPALSMATMIVAGLGLYVAGFALDRVSWTLGTAGITLVVLALTAVPERVWQGEEEDAEPMRVVRPDAPPGPFAQGFAPGTEEPRVDRRRLITQVLPLVLVLAVLGAAGVLSYRSSSDAYRVTVTALSAAPPGAVTAAGTRQLEVTASGLVAADGPYTVAVVSPGGARTAELAVPSGRSEWVADLTIPAGSRVTVGLYRAGDTSPCRTIVIAAAG